MCEKGGNVVRIGRGATHYNRLGILWLGKNDWGWLVTIGSHILLGLDLWGVRNSKIRLGVIYHCSIRHMYRIQRMGTMCAFIGNDKERVSGGRPNICGNHIFMWVIFLSHILTRVIFPFLGQPLKKLAALDGLLVFLPHDSSPSIRVCCIYLIMTNSSQN